MTISLRASIIRIMVIDLTVIMDLAMIVIILAMVVMGITVVTIAMIEMVVPIITVMVASWITNQYLLRMQRTAITARQIIHIVRMIVRIVIMRRIRRISIILRRMAVRSRISPSLRRWKKRSSPSRFLIILPSANLLSV